MTGKYETFKNGSVRENEENEWETKPKSIIRKKKRQEYDKVSIEQKLSSV